jgi:hypothetical protein
MISKTPSYESDQRLDDVLRDQFTAVAYLGSVHNRTVFRISEADWGMSYQGWEHEVALSRSHRTWTTMGVRGPRGVNECTHLITAIIRRMHTGHAAKTLHVADVCLDRRPCMVWQRSTVLPSTQKSSTATLKPSHAGRLYQRYKAVHLGDLVQEAAPLNFYPKSWWIAVIRRRLVTGFSKNRLAPASKQRLW